jgi:predicted unusual protein kinase regulating ubiquinone biosynthesis (AarF/ABC1/UbiB family)
MKQWHYMKSDNKKSLKSIKSGLLSRGLSLAKMTVSTSSQLAIHHLTNVFNDKDGKAQYWNEFLVNQASLITSELGELKGSLMKAGQMLSMYGEHFLPREANNFLKTLQHQSPPLEWPAIEELLNLYLSKEQLAQLEIDHFATASASMGQVHRGTIKATGQKVAIKIQYKGLENAIDNDLKAIKAILLLLKLLPKDFDTTELFSEVKTMLLQEMDYEQEANTTIEYARLLDGDSRFIVPKVFKEFSSKRVLVTSWEDGVTIDSLEFQKISQQRKNKLSENYLDLYFKEIFKWGLVQTDPHLGNYKIRINTNEKDQLICLDFGAVRRYPDSFLFPYHRMIKAALLNKKEALSDAARQLKYLDTNDNPDLIKHFEDFCLSMVEPFISYDDPRNSKSQIDGTGEYDWSQSDLPDRLTKIVFSMIQKFHLRSPPKEVVFLDRKTGGVFIFLKVAKAKINGRKILWPYIDSIK